jgi:PBSX family phage terminase large subunit
MQLAMNCPGNQIWMIGYTLESVYHNCIRMILSGEHAFGMFAKFCTWMPGKHELHFGDKVINCLGARDERAIGPIQGKTFDLCYCNEMTLYPENIIQMIATRLSNPHSTLLADMNPVQPSHKCKEWVDLAKTDPRYYAMHFTIEDNPYLTDDFKKMTKQSLSGLFYRRYYLGEWCLAEGAIFDFFDKKIHVVSRPPRAAEFWIAGIDYGASNAFSCIIFGVCTGRYAQEGGHIWAEKEYYWDSKKQNRGKTNGEYARDLEMFFEGYSIRTIYIDPSAASFKTELQRINYHAVDADNDVFNGIQTMTNLMNEGSFTVMNTCPNLIREIEGYVWDPKKSSKGEDAPIKENDHCLDASRYALKSYMKGRHSLKRENVTDPDFGRNLGRPRNNQIDWGNGWSRF